MKGVHELGCGVVVVTQALSSSKSMLNGMSFSKQYFSTSRIKWWKKPVLENCLCNSGFGVIVLFPTMGRKSMGYVYKGS